jgi:hypothetical protein
MTATSQNLLADAGGINLTVLLRNVFAQSVPDMMYRHGNPLARLIRPGEIVNSTGAGAEEGGRVFQMRTGYADSARSTLTALDDFKSPRQSRADKIRVRFNIEDPSQNDINRMETASRINIADMKRASDAGVAVNIAENSIRDAVEGLDEADEILMHSDKTAAIGTINGPPKNNDDSVFTSATTYTPGSNSARILVSNYSIGIFKPNMHLDIYNGASLVADEVRITDVNYEDFSVGIALTDRSTVANLNGVLTTHTIYRSGERNQGYKGGFGELFKTSYAADSWFGGTDRNSADKRHFQPIRTRTASASTARMSDKIMAVLVRAVSQFRGMDRITSNYSLVMGLEAVDNWREDVSNAATNMQSAQGRAALQVGEEGLFFTHPALGRINITATRTARNDRAILFLPSDMQKLYGDFKGLDIVSNGNGGIWERVPGTGVNGGGSVFYRYEALMYSTPFASNLNSMAAAFNIE